jgi:hypothetical protein
VSVAGPSTPPIVVEYARENQMDLDVALEHFEVYYDSDEDRVRRAIDHQRRRRRDSDLLRGLTPSVAYDNEVLRALGRLGRRALVGDIASTFTRRP